MNQKVLVDKGESHPAGGADNATLKYDYAPGTGISNGSVQYVRGNVTLAYTVMDRWLPLYLGMNPSGSGSIFGTTASSLLTIRHSATQGGPETSLAPHAPTSVAQDGSSSKWVLKFNLADYEGLGASGMPTEGFYSGSFSYASATVSAPQTNFTDLCIDYTGPSAGQLTFSQTSIAKWGWLVATSQMNVTLNDVQDAVSGINQSTVAFTHPPTFLMNHGDTTPMEMPTYASTDSNTPSHQGNVAFALKGDGQRFGLDVGLTLDDMAGNHFNWGFAGPNAFVNYPSAMTDLPGGVQRIVMDLKAPVITVSYDNNDVKNGKYYKQHRTATVSIDESNFDIIRDNDPNRAIVTTTLDGHETKIPASEFENPSGDGHTWITTVKFDQDGDWTVRAGFVDVGNHESNTVVNDFTIDTVKPNLTVTFDNNDVHNGMYYNANRVATVTEQERNFSAEDSTVTTTAVDDSKTPVAGPTGQGWSRVGADADNKWAQEVAFTNELHYTLEAQATDLAGNTAEVVEVPEFVIDKSAPKVEISKVANHTAYAGTVAPMIKFEDANINDSMDKYELTGAVRHDVTKKEASTVTSDENSQTISFSDFKRNVSEDDIYTLNASITDLAGNSSRVSTMFSVNRFGSTYMFDPSTQMVNGSYLQKPRDIVVTEVNVSGLDTSKSSVQVAKDTAMSSLSRNQYSIVQSHEKSGWSDTKYLLPASLFKENNYYRLLLTSYDMAGNLSQNTMDKKDSKRKKPAMLNFAIDSTKPTSAVFGVNGGTVYFGSTRQVKMDSKDNMALKSAVLEVDGKTVEKWNEKSLDGMVNYSIKADSEAHTITYITTDKAGNVASYAVSGVTLSPNQWEYITHTPWLLDLVIAAFVLLIGILAIGIGLIVHHRRSTEYRRNPFEQEAQMPSRA